LSNIDKPDDVETLIRDFERSGMRELHLRCDQFELYLTTDPDGRLSQAAAETRTAPAASTAASTAASPAAFAGRSAGAQAASDPPPAEPDSAAAVERWPANAAVVRAPYLGTFYRAPKPGSKPYVQIGDTVVPESDLCLVEVMKLFTAVRAGVAGRVHAILAKDGQLVEGDQPLFVLTPG
jgi:acetyl-CoA carboxylase biotin carboxyl carrier protein